MTERAVCNIAFLTLIAAAVAIPCALQAQGAPTRPVVAPPPAPPAAVVAPTPPDSAVALCNDGTWVKLPRTSGDCSMRGGLRVAMPPRPVAPPTPFAAPEANRNVIATRAATLNTGIPDNSTMQCKDGTFLFGAPSEARCAQNGGVAAIFPPPPPPPPAPPRRP